MRVQRLLCAVAVLALLVTPARTSADALCPGHCESTECHNGVNDPCNQGCQMVVQGGHLVCRFFGCICPGGLSSRPWDAYSMPSGH
jgi:hypothetical protein